MKRILIEILIKREERIEYLLFLTFKTYFLFIIIII